MDDVSDFILRDTDRIPIYQLENKPDGISHETVLGISIYIPNVKDSFTCP